MEYAYPPQMVHGEHVTLVDRVVEFRRCRDVPFLILFVAFCAGMLVVASIGYSQGKPQRLLYGLDYKGNLCGSKDASPSLKGFNVRYWINPRQMIESADPILSLSLRDARAICLKDCPEVGGRNDTVAWVCDYPEVSQTNSSHPLHQLSMDDWFNRTYDYYALLDEEQQQSSLDLRGPCYPVLIRTKSVFWSCQPDDNVSSEAYKIWNAIGGANITLQDVPIWSSVSRFLSSPAAVLERYVADLGKAWPVLIVCASIIPFILSFTWLVCVRFFTRITVWSTIILVNGVGLLVVLLFYAKGGWLDQNAVEAVVGDDGAAQVLGFTGQQPERKDLRIMAVILTVLLGILFVFTMVMIRHLHFAVAILKEASRAMAAIPSLLVFPFFPVVITVLFGIFWVSVALSLFSGGDVKQRLCTYSGECCAYSVPQLETVCGPENCCGYEIKYNTRLKWAMVYHIFGCFWILQFIVACSLTIIAGAVASFYWCHSDHSTLPYHQVTKATRRTFFYSLGSIALGSLIVAVVEMIRWVCDYIRRKLLSDDNSLIRYVCCCTECCIVCLDYIVKFVSRNAYIMIAIKGYSFCEAAAKASVLIVNNILRVAAVNVIGDFILFLGKILVSLGCAFFAFLMLEDNRYHEGRYKITSPLAPVLFCMGVGYIVAYIFFGVVEMAVDTILLSFCEDCEENNGIPRFAPMRLVQALRAAQEEHEERIAERERRQRRKEAESRILAMPVPHIPR
ncbi:hypothetical protein CBR_g50441 [Chara braunii]|uniref:Choline transporter-like protein n=1 Tax=Chara braunii TaxID=69332 RepID=A0A388M6Z9_CHABU|nr:hypothetical protein CBR_g50441 [Chara braunii]|eukprot:GBG90263.1 hypothetical protein CBR_g50441 [Chara braunii]